MVKHSFLSNLIGNSNYESFKEHARDVVVGGCCILIILYTLSFFYYSEIISFLLKILTGYSLLFIGFLMELILFLDVEIEEDLTEYNDRENNKLIIRSKKYLLTIIWGVCLLLMSIFLVFFTNQYWKQYSFKSDTFIVDRHAKIYHLYYNDDCEIAKKAERLEEMKGYQIDSSFKLCSYCKEWEEELEP